MTATTYAELAAAVVAEVAPQELALLEEVTRSWLGGDLGGEPGGWSGGGSIGIGLDPALITLVIYPVVSGAVASVLSSSATGSWNLLLRRWTRRRRKTPVEVEVPALTPQELEQVREACYVRAVAAGLSKPKARLMADAVYGTLARDLFSPGDNPR